MQNKYPILHSLGHAVLVFLYITAVVSIMSNGSKIFGQKDTFFMPVAALLLFVLSATIVGGLVLGRPALMYFNGQKEEGLKFLGYTIVWLFVAVLIVFSYLLFIK